MKQECKDCNKSLEDCTCIEDTIDMKQETLEEAAEKYAEGKDSSSIFKAVHKKDFINGGKWQQEEIGKSEFLQKLRATSSDVQARILIFETFKNK